MLSFKTILLILLKFQKKNNDDIFFFFNRSRDEKQEIKISTIKNNFNFVT